MANIGEHQSDYEQHSHVALTEQKVLASVMHVAEQFCLSADTDAGDQRPSGPPTMKDIRTRSGLGAMAQAMTTAATVLQFTPAEAEVDDDVTVANKMVHNILDRVIGGPIDDDDGNADHVIDDTFMSNIMKEASLSISRCIGVHDLHLDSSKALLDGSTTAEDKLLEQEQQQQPEQQGDGDGVDGLDADPTDDGSNSKSSQTEQKKQIDRLVREMHDDESITGIIDYSALHFAEEPAVPYGDAKLLCVVPSTGRAESVGGGQPMDMEQILARKAAQHGGKGTWSRIKKVFSTISGRSQLQIPH